MKIKYKTAILSLIFLSIGYFISSIYRPFIYLNKIQDFGIADIGNNIVFIPSVYFITFTIKGSYLWGKYKDIKLHLIGLTILELISFFIDGIGTYDFKDIIGLCLGSVLTFLISKRYVVP